MSGSLQVRCRAHYLEGIQQTARQIRESIRYLLLGQQTTLNQEVENA